MKLKDMMYIAMFAAIIAALGLIPPITLPFTPVPITAQTFGVMLAGAVLGSKRGGLSLVVFVALVAVGAPILSGGNGGLGALVGPTAGYIWSWPIGAFIIGLLVEKSWTKLNVWQMVIYNIIGGVIVVYIGGISYLAAITELSWLQAAVTALVYIPGDVVKAVFSGIIALRIKKAYPLIEVKNNQKVA